MRPVSRSHGSLFELESSASQSDSMGLSAEHQSLVSKSEECLGFEDMWSDQVDTSLAYQPEVSLSDKGGFLKTIIKFSNSLQSKKLQAELF